MLPRCKLQLHSATQEDCCEYAATLADGELQPTYDKTPHVGTFASVYSMIRIAIRTEQMNRFTRVLAERDYALCELGKAKAQQRMETLRHYSPRRDQYA